MMLTWKTLMIALAKPHALPRFAADTLINLWLGIDP